MGPLIRLAVVLALAASLCVPRAACAEPLDRFAAHIAEASARFGVPEAWIERVIRAESGGRTHLDGRPITSHAGAMGLMQLMPATWRELRAELGLGSDPHAPRDNILAGTAYLRKMYDRFGYPGMFAAYNAGPARYARYLAGHAPLPAETRDYLATIAGAGALARTVALPLATPEPPVHEHLFYRLNGSPAERGGPGSGSPERPAGADLFALPPQE